MSAHLARIHTVLDGLARRDRRLRLLVGVAWGVAAVALGGTILAACVSFGYATPRVGWAWVGVPALVALVVAAWPLRGWRRAGDRRLQAGRVEGFEPAFRGELLTVLDRAARPMGSPALVERLAARTADRIAVVPAGGVLPAARARRPLVGAVLALAVLGVASALLPVGPVLAVQLLLAPSAEARAVLPPPSSGPHAVLGDVTLRYLYPTYTRLEPLDVPNSSGEVRAPPGTRVEIRARTAVAYEAAQLEVYDAEPAPVEITGGRDVAAAFTVAGPGVWRLRFGGLPTEDFAIVPDPDLPPDVSVDAGSRAVRGASDAPLALRWTAKDDYGVERVVVEVKERGAARTVELRRPLDAPRQVDGAGGITPAGLGLAAGARVTLRIGAWDNDAVSGSKVGWSAPIELEVIGPDGGGARAMELRRQLRDALLLVLADFLVEPSPAFVTGAEGTAWASGANARYEAFDALVRAAWGGAEGTGIDARAVAEVNARRRDLLAFARAGTGGVWADKDREALVGLQAAHVAVLEDAVLLFDQVLQRAAAEMLAKRAEELAEEAGALRDSFASLDRDQALARLDKLARQLERLRSAAADLGDATIEEFVNQRADGIDALMDEIRKAIAEGRMDDARGLMERLARQLDDLAQGLKEAQQQQGKSDDSMKKAVEQLDASLEQLERDQEALRGATERAREANGSDLDEALAAWAEAEKHASTAAAGLDALRQPLAADDVPSSVAGGLDDARAETGGLLDSIEARNLELAQERVIRAQSELAMLRGGLEAAARRVPSAADTLAVARRSVVTQQAELEQVRRILDLLARSRAGGSPQLQRALEQLAAQQRDIADRAEQAAKQAGQLAERLPMKAPGLERGAQRGADQSERAEEGLRDGDAMQAEGGQRAAAEGFREAREALQQAQRDLQQMQQASRGGSSEEGSKDRGAGDGNGTEADVGQIRLPAPEEFQTPEAYRNALLRGMSGDVPEEYRSLNRRYYEELVRQ